MAEIQQSSTEKTAERRQRRLPSFKPSFLTNGVYSSLTNNLVLPSHKERDLGLYGAGMMSFGTRLPLLAPSEHKWDTG